MAVSSALGSTFLRVSAFCCVTFSLLVSELDLLCVRVVFSCRALTVAGECDVRMNAFEREWAVLRCFT